MLYVPHTVLCGCILYRIQLLYYFALLLMVTAVYSGSAAHFSLLIRRRVCNGSLYAAVGQTKNGSKNA